MLFFHIFFFSIILCFSSNCMNHKKKQLVTIFDIHGKFFQKNSDDVKNVMTTPYTMELYAKETEEKVYTINLTENTSRTSQLLTREKLKSMFSLYDILKTKPKTLNRQQRKTLESANDFFILGDYFGTEDSAINHLKFLISRYGKPEELSPQLDPSSYRYSALELFEQGFLTKDDVLPPFDETDHLLGIDFTQLNITFGEFLVYFNLLNIKSLTTNNNGEILGIVGDYYKIPVAAEVKSKFLDSKLCTFEPNIGYCFNLPAINITTPNALEKFINTLKNHPATCLNLSNLNINSYEEIFKHLALTSEEKLRILTINLNRNNLKTLSCLSLLNKFWNLQFIKAKYNNINSLDEKINEWYNWSSYEILKNIHVNSAHNNIQRLPRALKYFRSKCGPCNWRNDKEKIQFASLNLTQNPLSAQTRLIIRNTNEQSKTLLVLKKIALCYTAYSFFTLYGYNMLHISTFLQFLKTECIDHKDEPLLQKIDRFIWPISIPATILAMPLGWVNFYFNNPSILHGNYINYLLMLVGLFGKKHRTNFFKIPSLPHKYPIKIDENESIYYRMEEYLAEIYDALFRIYRIEGPFYSMNTLWKKIIKLGRCT